MSTLDEVRRSGELPLWDVPGWLEQWGISAGITARETLSGVPFDLSLRGSRPVGETMGNWERFRAGFPADARLTSTRQTGGTGIIWLDHSLPGWTQLADADGQITSQANHFLLVSVADCVPLYLAAPEHGVVALLHAGWRGTAGRILARAVEMLAQREIPPEALVMHAGVAIAGPSYQVGAEVISAVGRVPEGSGPWYLDLREVLSEQAAALGIRKVTRSSMNTADCSGPFYSWRASGGDYGRMVAWIGMSTQRSADTWPTASD